MPYTAADAMVERLIEWGVDTVFGLPGDSINGFMQACRTALAARGSASAWETQLT